MSDSAFSSTSAFEFANSLDQEGMTKWLRQRFTGRDERFPLDRRIDELPHQLVGSLFKDVRLSEEAREKLKLATIFLLREARQDSGNVVWRHDDIEDLFLLLSDVFSPFSPQSRGDTLRSEAGQLLASWSRELPVRGSGSTRPRLGCLRAMRDLGWLETVDFWKNQWDPKYPETALPVLQGLVSFPGMEEEAFKWMAGQNAEHWNEIERLLKTLKPVWMKNPRIQANWDEWISRIFNAESEADALELPVQLRVERQTLGEMVAGSSGPANFPEPVEIKLDGEAAWVTVSRKRDVTAIAQVETLHQLRRGGMMTGTDEGIVHDAILQGLARAVLNGMGCPDSLIDQFIRTVCHQWSNLPISKMRGSI
jgi:hypothetical protein